MSEHDEFSEAGIFPDRRCWIGWKAYLAEHDAFELAEDASTVLLASAAGTLAGRAALAAAGGGAVVAI